MQTRAQSRKRVFRDEDYPRPHVIEEEPRPQVPADDQRPRVNVTPHMELYEPRSILVGTCPVCGVGRGTFSWKEYSSTKSVRFLLAEVPRDSVESGDSEVEDTAGYSVEPQRNFNNMCIICDKVFSTKDNMLRHMKIHSDERPFSCLFCQLRFRQKVHVIRHIASMHCLPDEENSSVKYNCVFCRQGFMEKTVLRKHISANHKDDV